MEPRRVSGSRGAEWVRAGWQVFTTSPGMWVVFTVVWALIFLVFQIVPMVGPLLFQLISPALAGGWLLAARNTRSGEGFDVGVLFQPLVDPGSRGPMLVLGILLIGINLLIMLVIGGLVASTMHGMGGMGGDGGQAGMGQPGMLLPAMLGMLVMVIVLALFYFAIPLALFARLAPTTALAEGIRGLVRNLPAVLVLGAIALALAIAATVPLLLGWLVLVPVMAGAWYTSYQEVFPTADSNEPVAAE